MCFFYQVVFTLIMTLLRLKRRHDNHCNCLEDEVHDQSLIFCKLAWWKHHSVASTFYKIQSECVNRIIHLARFNLQNQIQDMLYILSAQNKVMKGAIFFSFFILKCLATCCCVSLLQLYLNLVRLFIRWLHSEAAEGKQWGRWMDKGKRKINMGVEVSKPVPISIFKAREDVRKKLISVCTESKNHFFLQIKWAKNLPLVVYLKKMEIYWVEYDFLSP